MKQAISSVPALAYSDAVAIKLTRSPSMRAEYAGQSFFTFRFGADKPGDRDSFPIQLQALGDSPKIEQWLSDEQVIAEPDGEIRCVESGEHLLLALSAPCGDDELEGLVERSYYRLVSKGRERGFAHPVRAWNFMPAINLGEGDTERYRRFTVGRALAFDALGIGEKQLPAGTAIGSGAGSALSIILLLARKPALMLGNSRQVNAYSYPSQYGPRSPSFSRAAIVKSKDGCCLLISGTASVVGHESVHIGNIAAQTEETCHNILQLIEDARQRAGLEAGSYQRACFRIYVREPADLQAVKKVHDKYFSGEPVIFLQGDVCRKELLVETEAVIWL